MKNENNAQLKQDVNLKMYNVARAGLRRAGFGERLDGRLLEELEKGKLLFELQDVHRFGNDLVRSDLYFNVNGQNPPLRSFFIEVYESGAEQPLVRTGIAPGDPPYLTLRESYELAKGNALQKDRLGKDKEKVHFFRMDKNRADDYANRVIEYLGTDKEAVQARFKIVDSDNLLDRKHNAALKTGTDAKFSAKNEPDQEAARLRGMRRGI